MADSDPPRQLSLVPYASDSREVVLRHGNSVVVYDPESKVISLKDREASQAFDKPTECPMCHRPLHDTSPFFEEDETTTSQNDEFVNPEYFRMLAKSRPPSPASSTPTIPFRRLPALNDSTSQGETERPAASTNSLRNGPLPPKSDPDISTSSFNPNYFNSFFVVKRELGRGGRGVVLLVEHRIDGVFLGEFAAKRIPVGNDHAWLEKVLVEVQLLQQLTHSNLVSYHHVWLEDATITSFGPSVPCVFILQKFCNGGDLHDYVLKSLKDSMQSDDPKEQLRRRRKSHLADSTPEIASPRKMQFDEIFSFFRDITSGLHHLHTNGYIHRDLKPSNCLLLRSGKKLTVQVSDFGEVQATGARRSSTGATGTISYCAPEVLRKDSSDGAFGNFTTKSDIFSLGMIVYFMCFGHLPYANADELNEDNEDIDELRKEVSRWNGFDESTRTRTDLPERLYRFLKQLLSPDPSKRPSTGQILQAIQGGGDIDIPAFHSPELNETSPRFTSFPTSTGSSPLLERRRRTSGGTSTRPALTQAGRLRSSGENTPTENTTRGGREASSSRNTDGVVIRNPKAQNSPHPPEKTDQIPHATRLIMPPPPAKNDMILSGLQHPIVFKIMAFCLKLGTVSRPCLPYAVNPSVFYILMILAAIDFLLQVGLTASFVLLAIHFIIWTAAMRLQQLCPSGPSA